MVRRQGAGFTDRLRLRHGTRDVIGVFGCREYLRIKFSKYLFGYLKNILGAFLRDIAHFALVKRIQPEG